jgi:hypothetical protein
MPEQLLSQIITCVLESQIVSWFGKGGSTSVPITGGPTDQMGPTPKSSKPETKEGIITIFCMIENTFDVSRVFFSPDYPYTRGCTHTCN